MTWQVIKDGTFVFPIFMADTSDHLTGSTGETVTVQLSKNGGAFGAASGSVSELSGGWYKLSANATDLNTEGPLIIEASATGCDKWRDLAHVYIVVPVNVKQVNGSAVTGVADFKADVSSLALQATLTSVKTATDKLTFNAANIILADIREVNDSAVTGVADFKADVSGLSTFDPLTEPVILDPAGLDDIDTTIPTAKPFNYRQMILMIYQRIYGPTELDSSSGTITVFQDDETTGIVYQDVTDTGTVQTQSLAANVP